VSIHDINLVVLRKKDSLSDNITGCTITPICKFIFANYGMKGLHILNEDWTSDNLDTKLPAIRNPYDVTCIIYFVAADCIGCLISMVYVVSRRYNIRTVRKHFLFN
jgi:hypothetical protein